MHRAETGESVAAQWARFVVGLDYADLPASALAHAKALILDQLGCQLVGSTMTWVEPAVALASLYAGAAPESTVANRPLRLPAAEAAFVNASFGHACELDDSAYGSAGHIGTATIPAALAVAEREGASGRDVLVAVIAGYEIMYRLIASVAPHNTTRGFHSQSIGGTFAAAAAAGKLLGLNAEAMMHALAIAGSHSSGTTEYDQSGGEVKRVHAGIAARGGVQSALLAGFGLTGPTTVVEGKRGFINVFSDVSDPSRLPVRTGEGLAIHNASYKMYPTVGFAHTTISGTTRLARENDIRPEEVERIRVRMNASGVTHVSSITVPSDAIGAQFSLAFSVALAIARRRNDLSDYLNPTLWTDPELVRLMHKLEAGPHPDATGKDMRLAEIEIDLTDGRRLKTLERHMKGTPPNPATEEERHAKFRSLARSALPADRVEAILAIVGALETLADVNELTRLLARAS